MKKQLILLLCMVLLCVWSSPAFAAGISAPGSSDIRITTTVAPAYTVTIPAETSIAYGAVSTSFGEIELTTANLEAGYVVQVSVAAGALQNTAGNTIAYAILADGAAFTAAEYDTAGEKTALSIAIAQSEWNGAKAGSYSGNVTFTVAYKAAN